MPGLRRILLFVLLLAAPAGAQQTRAERTNNRETSRYSEVVAFLEQVDAASPRIHLATFGYSWEGRPLPLAVWGDVADATPEAVLKSGKTRVFIQANIHAGEVEGKEAMLMLLRALARGEHAKWADSLVLLIAPIYNADGNERITLGNRPLQHGPVGGMGQRPNAQGYDLNRDHTKLDTPEARSLVGLLRKYDPHVAVDLHTTNGTYHAYQLTYAPPLHPNTDPSITGLLRRDWLPSVTRTIRAKHGWDFYHYGNLPDEGDATPRGWYSFDHRPRFNNNYVGLRNRFAILSEAYAYLPFGERIVVTLRFVEEILDYAHSHASTIRKSVAAADRRTLVGQRLALRATHQRSPAPATILLGDVARERHPYTGAPILRRLDARRPERMPEWIAFQPTETERVPAAYLVPPGLEGVVERLEAHGIRFHALTRPTQVTAESFRIDSTRVAERPFQMHRERTLWGGYQPVSTPVPTGTLVVPADQPLGRLVFTLLEPRSDDGFVNWNVLDEALEGAKSYPILRTLRPVP